MILPIYNAFHPILKQKTNDVENFDDRLKKLISDMFETMIFAEGIGLAANQIGQSISLLVVGDIKEDGVLKHKRKAYINPVIEDWTEEYVDYNEGCLSVPELREDITRPKAIQIKYYDEDMKENREEVDGLLARVLQHEVDHLNGILFFERLSPIKRTLIQNKLKKIKKGVIVPDYPMVLPNGKVLGSISKSTVQT